MLPCTFIIPCASTTTISRHVFAVVIVGYFWWQNTKGLHESSDKAMKIMKITSVMVVLLIVWCLITIFKTGAHLPPLPSVSNFKMERETWGWLTGTGFSKLVWVIVIVGFGHSVLAMSGEETLAQVNREIEHPKLKNLERAGMVIFVYSLLFTSLVSFFAVMIIPDSVRSAVLREPDWRHRDVPCGADATRSYCSMRL